MSFRKQILIVRHRNPAIILLIKIKHWDRRIVCYAAENEKFAACNSATVLPSVMAHRFRQIVKRLGFKIKPQYWGQELALVVVAVLHSASSDEYRLIALICEGIQVSCFFSTGNRSIRPFSGLDLEDILYEPRLKLLWRIEYVRKNQQVISD